MTIDPTSTAALKVPPIGDVTSYPISTRTLDFEPPMAVAAVPIPIPRLVVLGVYLVFFFSGLASLICEVIWFKQLQFVLGSSTFAISVVVASFFSGLSLGSWFCGRLADRWQRLLLGYAVLELALAVISAAVTWLLATSPDWIGWIAPGLLAESPLKTPLMILVSMAVLLPPTTLMGATLPVLSKYLVRHRNELACRVGLLYGINTLGAAMGCFLVGFVLIGYFGVIHSALIGSAIYLLIGLVIGGAGLFSREFVTIKRQADKGAIITSDSTTSSGLSLVAVFGLMGFAAIAYEVLWFRILTNFSVHSVYAFSGMLGTYLLGLVLGSFICAKFLSPHKQRHLVYFSRVQLLIAITATVSVVMLGKSQGILLAAGNLEQWLGIDSYLFQASSGVSTFLLLSMTVLLLPATLIGIAFPLATELTIGHLGRLGSRLGLLYGLNTLGGVFGSLATGFLLLPLLGSQASFMIVLLLTLSLFAVTIATQPSLRRSGTLWREGAVTAALLVAVFGYVGRDYLKDSQTNYIDAVVLDFRESKDGTLVVLGYESSITQPFQQVIVNGRSFANNSPPGRRYMSTLAHLPALLHSDPESAVVIAIGTGTTVGSLTLHPSIERIWAVDISRDVFEVAPHFVPLNRDFVNSTKVNQVVADGRHFLLCTDQKFDVLTFEPPPPDDAGIVNLYSQDFYRLARKRLCDDGLVCQWVPLDLNRGVLSRMLIKSMMAEFPHVSLWISNRAEGIVVGSMHPLSIDFDTLSRRMAQRELQSDLKAYGLAKPEQLLATFVAADQDLARFVGDVPVVTDNRPHVEYFNLFPLKQLRYDEILSFRRPVEPWLTQPEINADRLEAARRVITDIWYSHELKMDGRLDEARERLLNAQSIDPANEYLRYLIAYLERKQATTPGP